MKILFLGEPGSPNTISWANGLRQLGCEVHIASARTDGSDDNLPIGHEFLPPRLRILFGLLSLKKIIRNLKPDLIIAYHIPSYGFLAALTGFRPLVTAAMNEQIVHLPKPNPFRRKILSRLTRFAIRRSDLIHAWGANIKDGLLRFGADREKILVLHRGINLDNFKAPGRKSFDPDKPVFISTRSLYPHYMIDALVQAFARVVEKVPAATLEIVGDGPELGKLKDLAENLNLGSNVHFTGRVEPDKIGSVLESGDIYVSLITTEGVSSSLLEAMVMQLLPIVPDIPSSRALLENGQNGMLFHDSTPQAVADQMLKAVANYQKFIPELEKNSSRVKKAFDRKKNLSIFLDRYSALVDENTSKNIFVYKNDNGKSDVFLLYSDISATGIDSNSADIFKRLAEKHPGRTFYIVGRNSGKEEDFLFSLPYNCLFIPENDTCGFEWALNNAGIFCDFRKMPVSLERICRALHSGLITITRGNTTLPGNFDFTDTGETFSVHNLDSILEKIS